MSFTRTGTSCAWTTMGAASRASHMREAGRGKRIVRIVEPSSNDGAVSHIRPRTRRYTTSHNVSAGVRSARRQPDRRGIAASPPPEFAQLYRDDAGQPTGAGKQVG